MREACPLAEDGDQDVDGDGHPHLDAYGVLGCPVESLDSQMLLDPLEEKFDLPAGLVQVGDSEGRQEEVVGDEHKVFVCRRIAVADPAQGVWIMAMRDESGECDRLVEADARRFVRRMRIPPVEPGALPCPGDEKRPAPVQAVQPGVIQIGPVHDVKRPRVEAKLVQDVHVVDAAGRDDNYGGEVAAQRQKRMELDGGLRPPERRPRKKGEAQIDGRRVQRVRRLLQLRAKNLCSVKVRGLGDQDVCEVGEDVPVPLLVGVGQRAAGCAGPYPAVIQFRPESPEAGLDVPETLPVCQLGERKDQELLVAAHRPDMKIALVPFDALRQLVLRQPVHELGKNGPSLVHDLPLPVVDTGKGWRKRL